MESQVVTGELSTANSQCWKEAIEKFNATLTDDNKKRIQLGSISFQDMRGINDLFRTSLTAKLLHEETNTGVSARLHGILKTVNKYAKVFDVFIQQQPDITAVVWGSIRFLLQVAVEEDEAAQEIGNTLVDIIAAIGRWEKYLDEFSTSPRVIERITLLYAVIVSFLTRARSFYQKSKSVRYAKACLTPCKAKFAALSASIDKHSSELEKEYELEAQISNVRNLKNMGKLQLENWRVAHVTYALTAKTDHVTQRIYSQGNALGGQIQASQDQDEVRRLVKWLATGWRQSQTPVEPLEGTCLWLPRHKAYRDWVKSNYNGILWISGTLGCGKSVLAKFLSANTSTKPTLAPYEFRTAVDKEPSAPAALVAYILTWILGRYGVTKNENFGAIRESLNILSHQFKGNCSKVPLKTLWAILVELIDMIPTFTLIIDGMDQCHFEDPKELNDFLARIERLASKTRIIVLSRPFAMSNQYMERATLIYMSSTLVDSDVKLFVDQQISENHDLVRVRTQILDRVAKDCQGMFLWAVLLLKYVQDGLTRKMILSRVQEYPRGLNLAYETSLAVSTSRLDPAAICLRREVLLIILEARRPLTVDELCVALALSFSSPELDEEELPLDPEKRLPAVCCPLVEIAERHVQFIHPSVNEFLVQSNANDTTGDVSIHISYDDSNSYLARKCLIRLSETQYQSPDRIAPILRKNVNPESSYVIRDGLLLETEVLYEYAAAYWHIHLTAIPDPEADILFLAQEFLHKNQFVMWAEYIFAKYQDNSPIAVVEGRLKSWYSHLLPGSKEKIDISDFFTSPYRALSITYESEGDDKTLQWLCLIRLGSWYMMAPDLEAADKVKQEVVEGLIKLLGTKNPLTLRARAALALNYFIVGKMRIAAETYLEISRTQLEVVGAEKSDSFESLMYAAAAQYYMTEYSVSSTNQSQAAAGFWRILGPSSTFTLTSQLFYGFALAGLAQLDPSLAIFEDIYRRRSEVLGPDNGMGLHAQVALADVARKAGLFEKAESNLMKAYEARIRIWGIKPFTSIDTAIHLIILFREIGKADKAEEYIETLLKPGIVDPYLERLCQVSHLRALLKIDAGDYEIARDILLSLLEQVYQAGRESYNRSFLWLLLTLATTLRHLGKTDEASELFEDLVEPISESDSNSVNSLEGEPEPPRLLRIAEEALRLARRRRQREADQLLEENNVRWKREADFWIPTGGPSADTAWMRGP